MWLLNIMDAYVKVVKMNLQSNALFNKHQCPCQTPSLEVALFQRNYEPIFVSILAIDANQILGVYIKY